MAGIRKVEPKISSPIAAPQAEAPKALSPSELSEIVKKIFDSASHKASPGALPAQAQIFESALPLLKDALSKAGPHKADVLTNVARRLDDPNLKVTPQVLDGLAALGVNVDGARAHLARNTDLKTTQQLGQTQEKTVAEKVSGAAATENALGAQKAVLESHKGAAVAKNELTPEYKLAKQLVGDIAGKLWSDKAPPELKAIKEAIGPQVGALAQQTAMSVMSDPNAMANISQLMAKFGKDGFQAALSSSTKEIAGHFLNTAGVQAKNPEAIKAALQGIEQLAPKLGAGLGPKVAETAAKLGPRILGDAAHAGASTAAAGAATAAKAGATAAKAGGQALPVIGNIISVGSTLLAGANFIGQLMKKPRDFEKIMKEGINTVLQGVGIAFPWVALGGTVMDAAWGAKVSVSDQKKAAAGIPVTENANVAAALPLLSDSAQMLQAVLHGAGKTDAADKVGQLMATTKTMADLDLNKPENRMSLLRKSEQEALIAMAHESRVELEAAAKEETGSRKSQYLSLASNFGALADTVLASTRLDKREGMPGVDDQQKKDIQTKRNELAGKLMKQLGDLGLLELQRKAEQQQA